MQLPPPHYNARAHGLRRIVLGRLVQSKENAAESWADEDPRGLPARHTNNDHTPEHVHDAWARRAEGSVQGGCPSCLIEVRPHEQFLSLVKGLGPISKDEEDWLS